ncbi:MAG TPA: ribonuclease H-like domain-containing protein, partial [Candidatus Dormibacteraeota bacterium]
MPPPALRERLASLGRGAEPVARPRRPAVDRIVPPGFEAVETAHGTAWRYADVIAPGRLLGSPPVPPHAYLDTETTGLSGGTGTQVFAVAVCRPCAAGLELTQLFLADPAGEAAFLALVQDELSRDGGLATYNGSRFDLPLLRTRWVMARMPGELEHPTHVDLLNLTRSLLRSRLERCTLRVVEERLLGFEREDDLASALVPEAYLAYLRHGWSPMLQMALEHNRQDVVSLYHLHARLLLRLEGRDPGMEGGADWLALGRHLFRTGRRADGWRALRNAADLADGPESARAALLLARRLA